MLLAVAEQVKAVVFALAARRQRKLRHQQQNEVYDSEHRRGTDVTASDHQGTATGN